MRYPNTGAHPCKPAVMPVVGKALLCSVFRTLWCDTVFWVLAMVFWIIFLSAHSQVSIKSSSLIYKTLETALHTIISQTCVRVTQRYASNLCVQYTDVAQVFQLTVVKCFWPCGCLCVCEGVFKNEIYYRSPPATDWQPVSERETHWLSKMWYTLRESETRERQTGRVMGNLRTRKSCQTSLGLLRCLACYTG